MQHHRESMSALQNSHAFAVMLHNAIVLQILRESMAPDTRCREETRGLFVKQTLSGKSEV